MTTYSQNEYMLLQEMSLFSGLARSTLEEVLRAGREREISASKILFFQGDPAETFFLLIHGRVKLTQVTPDGQQVILRYAAGGESFAVIAALSDTLYPVTAEAVEDCRVIAWDSNTMHRLMERHPAIAINALRILANRVKEFQDRMRELATERVERRIARTLLRLARQTGRKTEEGVLIGLPLSRQDLAEMTGTTLFTVSRTLSAWESKGLIKAGREQVTITFPHGLVVIAEDLPEREP